jgi:hypothetical protein
MSDEDQTNAFTYLVKVSKAIEISTIEPSQQERLGGGLDCLMPATSRRLACSIASSADLMVSNPMWQWFFRWTSEAASAAVSEFG